MKFRMMNHPLRAVAVVLSFCMCITSAYVHSQENIGDCVMPIDTSLGDQLLTKSEEVDVLNQRFFEDLARFEECLNIVSGGGGGGAAASGGGAASGTGAGQGSGSETFAAPVESVAATGVQGTELPEPELSPESGPEAPTSTESEPISGGKSAEEMEEADNDSILLSQIRQAAIDEEDPIKKQKLWDEYNKRKSASNITSGNNEAGGRK